MAPRTWLSLSTLLVLAACSTSTDDSTQGRTDPSTGETGAHGDAGTGGTRTGTTGGDNAGGPSGGKADAGGPGTGTASPGTGLPCDVQAVLNTHCASCHGTTIEFGAPFSLVTRDDLLAPVPDQGGKARIEVALGRVKNDSSPMPPAPNARLSAAEIASLQAWFDAGTPLSTESCQPSASGADAGSAYVDLPKPDDCEQTYELKAHGGSTPDDTSKFSIDASPTLEGNQYYCFYFDPPYGSDQGMYWFESILDNLPVLHHWILYATDNKTHESGTSAGCNAAEPGAYYVSGWAPGATNASVSPDIVLDLPSGPKAGLILEVHYFNNTGAPKQDASGIRFCTGKKTGRDHLAAVHTLGSEGICVQPGTQADVTGTCSPRTDMGDVHITGVWPHMHKTGRNMKVAITRKDGTVEVIHDKPFDFNAQVFYPLSDVVVHPGDTVQTTCTYENDTTSAIHYGERTQDEMCYSFTPAWPAGALAPKPSAFSDPTTAIGNRCADALSILQSCNGLQDRPMDVSQ